MGLLQVTVRIIEQLVFSISIFFSHILLKRLLFIYYTVKYLSVLHCTKYSFLFIVLLDIFGSFSLYRTFLSIRSFVGHLTLTVCISLSKSLSVMITLYVSSG